MTVNSKGPIDPTEGIKPQGVSDFVKKDEVSSRKSVQSNAVDPTQEKTANTGVETFREKAKSAASSSPAKLNTHKWEILKSIGNALSKIFRSIIKFFSLRQSSKPLAMEEPDRYPSPLRAAIVDTHPKGQQSLKASRAIESPKEDIPPPPPEDELEEEAPPYPHDLDEKLDKKDEDILPPPPEDEYEEVFESFNTKTQQQVNTDVESQNDEPKDEIDSFTPPQPPLSPKDLGSKEKTAKEASKDLGPEEATSKEGSSATPQTANKSTETPGKPKAATEGPNVLEHFRLGIPEPVKPQPSKSELQAFKVLQTNYKKLQDDISKLFKDSKGAFKDKVGEGDFDNLTRCMQDIEFLQDQLILLKKHAEFFGKEYKAIFQGVPDLLQQLYNTVASAETSIHSFILTLKRNEDPLKILNWSEALGKCGLLEAFKDIQTYKKPVQSPKSQPKLPEKPPSVPIWKRPYHWLFSQKPTTSGLGLSVKDYASDDDYEPYNPLFFENFDAERVKRSREDNPENDQTPNTAPISGIPNWNRDNYIINACYRNSSLQALRLFDSFIEKAGKAPEKRLDDKGEKPEADEIYKKRKDVQEKLSALITALNSNPRESLKKLRHKEAELRDAVIKSGLNIDIQGDSQQDAGRYVELILRGVLNYQCPMKQQTYVKPIIENGRTLEVEEPREEDIVGSPQMMISFLGSNHVQELIDDNFKPEERSGVSRIVEGNYRKVTIVETKRIVGEPPKFLPMQFNRVGKGNVINRTPLVWPENDIVDVTKAYDKPSSQVKYQLKSFVCHRGATATSGHYISYVKKGDVWFECNDAVVTRVAKEKVESEKANAYLAFFELIPPAASMVAGAPPEPLENKES